MRSECIQAVTQAIGRSLNQSELKDIENRLRRSMRAIAAEDPQAFRGLSVQERLQQGAARAAQELVHEAEKKKARTALTIMAHDRIGNYIAEQRSTGNMTGLEALKRVIAFRSDGKSNFMSIETRADAIKKNAIRQMLDTFEATDPRFFGFFENPEGVRALTLELFGVDSGVPAAKAGAKAWLEGTEALRRRFNAAGGDIGKLESWAVPQHHSQLRVSKAGRDAWVRDVLPLLDRAKYFNEDGTAMSDAQLVDFLGQAWTTIATGGVNKMTPGQMTGTGARANRGSESRQIHFAGPDEYLAYQSKFGERDLYSVMVGHVGGIAKDIAMVETLGPNPNHAYRLMRDTMLQAESMADPKKAGKFEEQATKLDNLYDYVAGRTQPIANERMAQAFDTLRNWLIASRLGSAFVTSFSDEATLHLTARLNNLPELQLVANQLSTLNPANRAELRMARRAGLALDTMLGELNRFGNEHLGNTTSSRVANTVMRLSGLNAITDARRRAFGVTMMDTIGALTREVDSVKALDSTDWRILKSKGITEQDWQVWRMAKTEDWDGRNTTMLTPEALARIPDAKIAAAFPDANPTRVREEAITKLLGTVMEEVDMAVIQPGARERAMMGAGLQRGTLKGELTRSFFLFKSFPIAMIMRHWERAIGAMPTTAGKAGYIAALMASTTVLGMASMQVNELLNGRDPKNMNPFDGKSGVKNWGAALLKGGSLGIYGDFLFSESTQHGGGPLAAVQGPVFSLFEDAIGLTQGNLVQMAQGKDTNFGAELVRFVKSNTPGANLWYAKAALDHLVFHQLQEMMSPGYLGRIQSRARREFGQEWWWTPGEVIPDRAPNFAAGVGQ